MRHRNVGRKLNVSSAHRTALFRNLTVALITEERILTTVPKAKEVRRYFEPLVTLSKTDTVARRRLAFARVRDKAAVAKLFEDLGPRLGSRPGGYLRVLKCGRRAGDSAPMAYVEIVGED